MKIGDLVYIGEKKFICIGDHPTQGGMGLIEIELYPLLDLALPEDITAADECEFRWDGDKKCWQW